jgi:hypothetical protein
MTRTRYASMGMLGLGIGYCLWYTPCSALAKAMSGGLLPSKPAPIGGLVLLPAAALRAMPVTPTALRWWRHARRRTVTGVTVATPGQRMSPDAKTALRRRIQGLVRGRPAELAQAYPAPSTAEGA